MQTKISSMIRKVNYDGISIEIRHCSVGNSNFLKKNIRSTEFSSGKHYSVEIKWNFLIKFLKIAFFKFLNPIFCICKLISQQHIQ